jgi:hypothetical protein
MKAEIKITQTFTMTLGHVEGASLEELNDKAMKLWESKKFCGVDLKETFQKEDPKITHIGSFYKEPQEVGEDEDLL